MRAGLVDVFLYDYEEFWFRDGHLLLRGNNGTGKSKVLALTLPFLLDAELAATRVEPDGDPAKRMEWNLLMGDRYDERLGYTWLELGRLAEDSEPTYVTLGCGIKAVKGRGVASRWFFITAGRPGVDFWLVGARGAALTRERLMEALEGRGRVYDRAEDYRAAVDERLFHLGRDRYAGLVNLLIQLRQPQLSKRPDTEKLSKALSEALRPVDQAILADVAEAFHDLERQREELRSLQDTRAQVEQFLHSYRHYAAVAARRQSEELRSAHYLFQETQRGLAGVRQELDSAQREDAEAAERQKATSLELSGARGHSRELRDNPAVRELEAAEQLAVVTAGQAVRATAQRDEADAELGERRSALEQAGDSAERSASRVAALAESSHAAAAAAGVAAGYQDLTSPLRLGSAEPADERAIQAAETAAVRLARSRLGAIAHLQELIGRAAEAARRLEEARRRRDELVSERDALHEEVEAAAQAVAEAMSALLEAWRAYAGALVELSLPDLEGLLAALADWTETMDRDDPAAVVLGEAARSAANALAELRAQALAREREREAALAPLLEERERLLRGEHTAPPARYTRDLGARTGRPGAPLWQLVDFRDHVPEADRAGLEAALEASGALDAWVTPDGRLLDASTRDEVVVAGSRVEPNLAAVLMAAVDRAHPQASAVTDGTVEAILAGMGLGAATADTWMELSGRWRLGVTEGSWRKPAAVFIGRGAREAARRRRLAELAAEIEAVQAEIEEARARTVAVEARQRDMDRELRLAPASQALREAHLGAAEARRRLGVAADRVTRQEAVVDDLARVATSEARARDETALDLALPADAPRLEQARHAVADYREAAAGLWPEARQHAERLRAVRVARAAVERAEAVAAERAGEAERAANAASEAQGRLEGLRASIRATVEEVRAQLTRLLTRIAELEAEATKLTERRLACQKRIGQAEGRLEELGSTLTRQGERRSGAVDALQRLGATGLLTVAIPDAELPAAPWLPEPAVRLARHVGQALVDVEAGDQAWDRIQRDIGLRFKELQDALAAHAHQAVVDLVDGRFVVTITFQGQRRAPDELVALLADDVAHRDRLLNARERQLLEEHLVNEVASHLQELISDAEAQVEQMNAELRQRPTSTGMRLRLRWAPRADGPAGLEEARHRLLRQVSDAWSLEDRQAVSAFLQQRVAAVRIEEETATWLEYLTIAFDYRAWHRFTIERWQDGRWLRATDPASSGERVLTVTLPLFAAASAHYRSAHPAAPRLVMLDEAFAGVDDNSRAKCMGLLDTFDLDFLMTSEREWGCYPTIGGLAIHQLARREGIEAVHITRWEWDGRAKTRLDAAITLLKAPTDNGHASDDEG
jgi:uncharacterized protein (TIGR02680 family)